MKSSLCPAVLIVALLGLGVASGQAPMFPPLGSNLPGNQPPASNLGAINAPGAPGELANPGNIDGAMGAGQPAGGPGLQSRAGLNDYLVYRRPVACCGPLGSSGPIQSEIFVRPGVSIPMGGGVLGQVMNPGFMIEGGARVLLFTPSKDLAWTIELGLSSVWYDAGVDRTVSLVNFNVPITQGTNPVIESVANLPITPSSMNQTYVHASIGHELYLIGLGDCEGDCKWRLGYDLGGRWGSGKLVMKERFFRSPLITENLTRPINERDIRLPNNPLVPYPFKHRTDTLGGLFGALHTDFEIPTKCCMFVVGARTEWAYIFSDLLRPGNNSDFMQINIMLNAGMRF